MEQPTKYPNRIGESNDVTCLFLYVVLENGVRLQHWYLIIYLFMSSRCVPSDQLAPRCYPTVLKSSHCFCIL